ncbi:unnamed protein product [Mycena citricolor]|uniref:FCP1 homology domain-containing protein n=1 Tax=Mycena citricolor TaxID=2018698 RepID=A0AAD2Q575_9AGAR|nr:unnamed protein product [Mycena citricolor]
MEVDPTASTSTAVISTPPITFQAEIETWIDLSFAWAGKPYSLRIAESDSGDLQSKWTPAKKFTLIGTPEGDEIKELELLADIVNNIDLDPEDPKLYKAYHNDPRNVRKVQEATSALTVNVIHPVREGKKLLVLDIDYTILDTKPLTSGSLPPSECARPHLHEFLEAVYPHYDICIWSQTSWIWLETKLVELGMSLQISFVLDKTPMFTVFSQRDGKPWSHSVKALQIIWNHFPQFDSSNTIHIDDLSRNFALNPQNGLKISAFRGAHTREALADRELVKLARYMVHIASMDDLGSLHHTKVLDGEQFVRVTILTEVRQDWHKVVRNLPSSETSEGS